MKLVRHINGNVHAAHGDSTYQFTRCGRDTMDTNWGYVHDGDERDVTCA